MKTFSWCPKYLAIRPPAVEIGWLRYLTFMLIMCPAVVAMTPRLALRTVRPDLQVLRGLTLVGSSLLFITALGFLPIAEATTTSFVSPIFVTVLSILFLRERVGIRRWIATIVGLIGVIIVVRPGTSAFHLAACLGIAATSGHWLVVLAYRYGDASVLAPFSYTQPIWATILGYMVFGDVPDGWTFVGAAVIIASGLYTAHRERVRRSNGALRTAGVKV